MTNPQLSSRGWRTARFWKPLEIATAWLALIAFFGAMSLWMYYAATRPITPDHDTGRVYAQNTHGSIVYLNRQEQSTISTLIWFAGGLFVVAVWIDMSVRPFQRGDTK